MSDTEKTRLVRRPLDIPANTVAPSNEDQPTRIVGRSDAVSPDTDIPTRKIRQSDSSDGPTRLVSGGETSGDRGDEGKTVLIRPARASAEKAAFHPLSPTGTSSPTDEIDPVVGWLIIIKGPGRGKAVQLGYGWNTIGRDASQRARLDFGDPQISRVNHARLLYDPKSRKFTLTLGESPNPTYVRDEVVLGPTKLENGDKIQFGDTIILFHGLCGETFDWQDLE